MSPQASGTQYRFTDFPRVSGDEPPPAARPEQFALFSPRERG